MNNKYQSSFNSLDSNHFVCFSEWGIFMFQSNGGSSVNIAFVMLVWQFLSNYMKIIIKLLWNNETVYKI